ncbi:hypothetical protein ACNKHK_18925 [Shigella flexneri]
MGNSTFACPGHQHGEFFKKHPAGLHFHQFFGQNPFARICATPTLSWRSADS